MDRRQKKRLFIFLVVPFFIAVLFFTDDIVIRIITIALMLIYIAFIIFLRDTLRFDTSVLRKKEEVADEPAMEEQRLDDSFQIISKHKNYDVITADTYSPDFKVQKTTLIPPDLKEKFQEIATESLPANIGYNGQFTFVLEKMLTVIKEAYSAHSAVFFWYNKKKEKLSIEKFASSSTEVASRKFDIEDDILSKIVLRGEPELLNEISSAAEADVIRYYNSPQGIRSFVGVPIFYDKTLIAIIAIDSKGEDSFGVETIYSLGRFVRLITMLISIFEEKHSETVSQQRLKGVLSLISPDQKLETIADLTESVKDFVKNLLDWDAFAFVYFQPLEQKFRTIKVINNTSLKYIGENLDIDLNGTLSGKSIVTGMPVKIDDTSTTAYVRFSKNEDLSFDGSFLAIPLIYGSQIYGLFCFESLKKNAYTNSDIQFLKSAFSMVSYIVYSYSTQSLLKKYLAVDLDTKSLNVDSFKERMKSDLTKAELLKVPGALALIRIDDFLEQESLFEGNPFPKVLEAVAEIISTETSPLTLFGRLGERLFAVYFFNSTTKDVFLWAEKLRIKIARKSIAVVTKQTTYTVSIGIASANNKLDVDEVIYNAELALKKALERGGNTVRNIN